MAAVSINSTIRLSSGYNIPILGLGVYQNYTTRESVLESFRAGYRHIDSAQVYRNEAHVGEAFRDSGLSREEVFITTKCISRNHGYEATLIGVDKSLQAFGVDYIDLFLIHDPFSGKTKRLDTYRALQECRQAGKIRSVGVSNYNIAHLQELLDAGYEAPSVNQVELHPFCQQRPLVEYCVAHDIAIEAYSPLVRGKEHALDNEEIALISAKHGKEAAQVLLRWSLQKGYIFLPKSATPSRIISNAKIFDFALDAEDMTKLDDLDRASDGSVTWSKACLESP